MCCRNAGPACAGGWRHARTPAKAASRPPDPWSVAHAETPNLSIPPIGHTCGRVQQARLGMGRGQLVAGAVCAWALIAAGQATASTVHCATRAPVSRRTGFIAKDLTASGIGRHDPHGSPCHIANWLTYYAERQNGLPARLALDPDGEVWTVRKRAVPDNAVRDTFTHARERVSVLLILPISTKDARRVAQGTLDDYEAAAHPDPYLNVADDAEHSDGGTITCRPGRTGSTCTTTVSYTEDAYWYTTDSSGQVWVNYKADKVTWTERFEFLPAIFVWHLHALFPQAPGASTYGGDRRFAGRALHRHPYDETLKCGEATHPCSMAPYPSG